MSIKLTLLGQLKLKMVFLSFSFGVAISFGFIVPENFCNEKQTTEKTTDEGCTVIPTIYTRALRNPMMGFTTINIQDHPWASLSHTYIRWNELENNESDGIDKIINLSNQKWKGASAKNMKVIPRVYLHWDGDKKYWPADMQTDDYTSAEFQERVLRLIKRLGTCWDNDPRVAFIEMGIIGKWGEHHSPSPSSETQKLLGDAFAKAFKNKKVSVRHMWDQFTDHPYGEYWDSWAHYDQMWGHGNGIKSLNDNTGRYKETYIGGEVAYGWGNTPIQPGETPTHSVSLQKHRDFVINSIRWLHCTQLRWIASYDRNNAEAVKGAEEIQKVFGYRYELDEVKFSISDSLKVSFDVINTGSAPFYYNWPIEVALLDKTTLKPIWKAKMNQVDIRKWLPGDGWTDPEWKYVGSWQQYQPDVNWNPSKKWQWASPPSKNHIEDRFKVNAPAGSYILSLSILDPAGELPSIKFATSNYLKGGRHPIGLVHVGKNQCEKLPVGFKFDDPNTDNTLYYTVNFKITENEDPAVKDLEQWPYGGKTWLFPTDKVYAWQYDYINDFSSNKQFSLDSAKTIGIYGCNNNSGENIRNYNDADEHKDAAQFKWNKSNGTFEKNGQWLIYTAYFSINTSYQLKIIARNNVESNFKLTVFSQKGDTIFAKDLNLRNDFSKIQDEMETTSWFLSKMEIKGLYGPLKIKFDWYDRINEPGVFVGFSFIESTLDFSAPKWHYVSLGTFDTGSNILVMTTENATVYLVPASTTKDSLSIVAAAISKENALAYKPVNLSTTDSTIGRFVVYAIDGSNNISEASKEIFLQYPVGSTKLAYEKSITLEFNHTSQRIKIHGSQPIKQVNIFSIGGKKIASSQHFSEDIEIETKHYIPGIYILHVVDNTGNLSIRKFSKTEIK